MVQVHEISSESEGKEYLAPVQKELAYHLSNSPLGVIEWDSDYKIKRITKQITQILGYTSDDLVGRKVTELAEELVINEDLDKALRVIQMIADGEITQEKLELQIRAKDGNNKDTRWYKSALRDRDDKLVSIFSLVDDITQQKNLERSRKRILNIIESTPDFVGMVNTEGKVFYVNSSGIEMLGIDKSQVGEYDIEDFHPREETKRLKEEIFPHVKEHGSWSGEVTFKSPETGTVVPTSSVIVCHRNEKGDIEYFSTISRDISLELQNRRAIVEQKNQLSLAMEGGQIGFWNYYPKEDRMDFSSSWILDVLGYSEKELSSEGEFWANLIHPDQFEAVADYFKRFLEGEELFFESEVRLKNKDGSYTWILNRAKIVDRDEQGNPVRISGIHMDVDDRVRAKKKLRKSRNRMRTALNIDTVGVIFWGGEELTIKEVNDTFLEMTGFTKKEVIGKSWQELTPEEFYPVSEKAIADIKETGHTKPFEKQYLRKDGTRFWGLFAPRRIDEHEAVEFVVDITDRKELEQQLKRERDFNRMAIESLPGLFYMVDEDQNFVLWNKNFEKDFGRNADEIKQMHPLDFYREKDHELVADKIQEALESGQAEVEVDILDKDGNPIRHYITGRKFTSEGKTYIVGSGIDITDRVEAERQLQLHDKLLTQLFENAPIGIVQLDKEERIKSANTSFEKIFQYDKEEIKGAKLDDLIVPDQLKIDQYELIKRQKKSQDDAFQYESIRIKKDGTEIPVLLEAVPVYIDSELVTNYMMYIDITDRKAFERKLKNALREKQVLLQEIHHRVKNNLAVISGLLQLKSFNTENLELQKELLDSQRRIKSMALIHEKLYKSESLSNIVFDQYIQDLGSSIKQALDTENKIDLLIESDSFKLNVNQAVPCALIVNELLSNAYEHGIKDKEDGQISICVQKDKKIVSISVKDNGPGLPEDFDPNLTSSMGFTIISTLIKQLNASLDIENKDNTHISFQFVQKDLKGSTSMLFDSD